MQNQKKNNMDTTPAQNPDKRTISAMFLNTGTLPYLLFRFAPFILISMFGFVSLTNQDIRFFLLASGLIITTLCVILFSKAIGNKTEVPFACSVLSINDKPLSNYSLNLTSYGFTFFYLLMPMIWKKTTNENLTTIVTFVLLIIAEFIWTLRNCHSKYPFEGFVTNTFVLGFSILCGYIWAKVIHSMKDDRLHFLNGLNTRETC